jgi:hypothetical protein
MVGQELPQVLRLAGKEVEPDPGSNGNMLDAGNTSDLAQQARGFPVSDPEVAADRRIDATGPATFGQSPLIATPGGIHIGRRSAQIGHRTFEPRKRGKLSDFLQYRRFASRLHDLALVMGYGAKRTTAQAASVSRY